MAKQFFRHNFYARTSPQLLDIRQEHGVLGYGIYWCLVEILFEQDGYILESAVKGIAYDLHSEKDAVFDILNNYGLFEFENGQYTAGWITESLKTKNELIEKLKENGSKGGKAKAKNKQNASSDVANASNGLANSSKPLANQLNKTKLNNNKIKLHKVISSDELTTNMERSDGSIYFLEILQEKLQDVCDADPMFAASCGERLKSLFEKISYEPNIKNGNATFETENVLSDLLNIFRNVNTDAVKDTVAKCFETVDSNPDVKNKYKYSISVFHNTALGV